jgi:hypothetical protein
VRGSAGGRSLFVVVPAGHDRHGSKADERRLEAVARDARRLARVPVPWSAALAILLEAGLTLARGDRPRAADLFQKAADQLASLDTSLFDAAWDSYAVNPAASLSPKPTRR